MNGQIYHRTLLAAFTAANQTEDAVQLLTTQEANGAAIWFWSNEHVELLKYVRPNIGHEAVERTVRLGDHLAAAISAVAPGTGSADGLLKLARVILAGSR